MTARPTTRPATLTLLSLGISLGAAACNGDGGSSSDGAASDTAVSDTAVSDTAVSDTAVSDTASPADAPAGEATTPEDHGSEDSGDDDAGGTPVPEYGTPCEMGKRVGAFEIANWDFYSSVTGDVQDGVIPLTVLQLAKELGACKLMQKKNPFCEPPCGGGQLCDHDGHCVPYPSNQSVGTVTVTGLLADVTMEPNPVKSYAETKVPFPLFDAGAAITLVASGGDLPAFELRAWGVPALAVQAEILTIEKGKALVVKWAPEPGPQRLYMTLNVDQHGNSPVTMLCDVPNTGSYTVDAELITALLDFGVSGFASFDLYRRTVDSVELSPGCVELRVFSFVQGKLTVKGHVPCFVDADCPDGMTCNKPINTCEE